MSHHGWWPSCLSVKGSPRLVGETGMQYNDRAVPLPEITQGKQDQNPKHLLLLPKIPISYFQTFHHLPLLNNLFHVKKKTPKTKNQKPKKKRLTHFLTVSPQLFLHGGHFCCFSSRKMEIREGDRKEECLTSTPFRREVLMVGTHLAVKLAKNPSHLLSWRCSN